MRNYGSFRNTATIRSASTADISTNRDDLIIDSVADLYSRKCGDMTFRRLRARAVIREGAPGTFYRAVATRHAGEVTHSYED